MRRALLPFAYAVSFLIGLAGLALCAVILAAGGAVIVAIFVIAGVAFIVGGLGWLVWRGIQRILWQLAYLDQHGLRVHEREAVERLEAEYRSLARVSRELVKRVG